MGWVSHTHLQEVEQLTLLSPSCHPAVTQLRPSCHPAAMHKAQPKSTCMRTCWLLCVHLQGEERLNTL